MSAESNENYQGGAAFVRPKNITYTGDGVKVRMEVHATDVESGLRAGMLAGKAFASQGIDEVLQQEPPRGRSKSSHAMPGERNWGAKWQPTGPDLSWMRPKNTGDPRSS